MKKMLWGMFLCSAVLVSVNLNAQDATVKEMKDASGKTITKDPNDTIPQVWKKGGLISVNINQGALSNWAAGGDKSSLSIASLINLYAFYKKDKHIWDNTLDLAYGLVNTTSLGTRKSDDRIDFLSKYGYQISPKNWYVGALFNFRTQFSKGYTYPEDKAKVQTSNFLAPAYILLSPNITYQPSDNFSVSLSPVTARWTIVADDSLSSVGAFGVDPGKKIKTEFGAFASVGYKTKLSETASYQGRLDLFSNYLQKPQNIDLYLTNILLVKVTKLITVSLSLDIIYDDDVKTVDKDGVTPRGPKPQLKEMMGIGLAYRFKN
ncbi:hypothetical protein DC498_05720 [Terrimonas sp.]|uniref:DUF3078 domain-containing protein n=1 Tax=Terrimonas sp. TaxID=1914338 RepID=UPI000D50DF1B|nr:DUF3078 domain-containing protein [Terrimonas sp.]PVD53438.1 hypothetical protein DC498_05720 [Terrimonas sp.]